MYVFKHKNEIRLKKKRKQKYQPIFTNRFSYLAFILFYKCMKLGFVHFELFIHHFRLFLLKYRFFIHLFIHFYLKMLFVIVCAGYSSVMFF